MSFGNSYNGGRTKMVRRKEKRWERPCKKNTETITVANLRREKTKKNKKKKQEKKNRNLNLSFSLVSQR
jgi:hypothetical protein